MAIHTLQSGKKRNGFLFGFYERLLCLLQSHDHSLDFVRSRPKSLDHDCQAPDRHFNRCSDVQNHSVTLTERLDEKWRTEPNASTWPASRAWRDCSAGTEMMVKSFGFTPDFSSAMTNDTWFVPPKPITPSFFDLKSAMVLNAGLAINSNVSLSPITQTALDGIPLKVALTLAGPTPAK